MHVGKSYTYPEKYTRLRDREIEMLSENDLCRLRVDGEFASACSSSRRNQHAAEAYVYTDERFRRQGYGRRVVRAWAQRVRRSGRVPFYSHLIDNTASQRLALSLGFEWYIDDVGYE
jgi:RimJ/RimL family protein N-acetyltransferase